jgi:tetraacyldisaccharide 4'-kinase
VTAPRVLRPLLWPASLIWSFAARVRVVAYRSGILPRKKLPGTVISVGNLTTGGTGKTPLVIWLAEKFHGEGKRVGILTRGYRAHGVGPDGKPQSDEVGIYRHWLDGVAEIGVGANRHATGEELAARGVNWFLLDDGFQHLRLARDVDIVLLDATDPFGGDLLPLGMLREPKSALTRADLIVITRAIRTPAVDAAIRRYTDAPIFHAQPDLLYLMERANPPSGFGSNGGGSRPAGPAYYEEPTFAFAGIGNPQAFFDDLKRWNVIMVGQMAFPDHHFYSQADADEIESRALAAGAHRIVCTEKDLHNLTRVRFRELRVDIAYIGMNVENAEGFLSAVTQLAERRRAKSLRTV